MGAGVRARTGRLRIDTAESVVVSYLLKIITLIG